MTLQPSQPALLHAFQARAPLMKADLEAWVARNTHSANKAGVDGLTDLLAERLAAMGFRVSELVNGVQGRTLVARRGGGPAADQLDSAEMKIERRTGPILMVGHMDTVHGEVGGFDRLVRVEGTTRAKGPGAADMKGGLVVMLHALEVLHAEGMLDGLPLRVVLNADEEIGSPASGELIRAEASEARACLCFEAGRELAEGATSIVTQRKGLLRLGVRARGRSAHAGVEPGLGASAVRELAVKVAAIESLAAEHEGASVLVGTFHGGTSANTVPEEATLDIDVRFDDDDTRQVIEDDLMGILRKPELRDATGRPRVATSVRERVFRPAMPRTEEGDALAQRVLNLGAQCGLNLQTEARGGSSDAALAADVGCPSVCGLGAVGGAFHTREEWVDLASLPQRAALLATLLRDLGQQ